MKEKIGILGGTFNPIHNGHTSMLLHCMEQFSLDRSIVIPAARPPHKTKVAITAFVYRLEMCQAATKHLSNIIVSDMESRINGPSYTVLTLEKLHQEYDAELYYIIGGDTLLELASWYAPEKLARLATFLCVRRPETDFGQYERAQHILREKYEMRIEYANFTGPNISSTQIRTLVKNGQSIHEWVSPEVEQYIYANELYK